jgi:hypothetical protein
MTSFLFALLISAAHADSLSVNFIGISHHGVANDYKGSPERLKRVIHDDGQIVWNPEIGVTYTADGITYNATVIDDCLGRTGYFMGAGPVWALSDTLRIGAAAGFYVYRLIIDHRRDASGRMRGADKPGWAVLATPWFIMQKDVAMSHNYFASVNAVSNIFLTHVMLGIGRSW